VIPDLTDVLALRAAFAGCDGVFHLAGLAHKPEDGTSQSLLRYREAIVSPTAAVLKAAVDAGVSSVIVVSSVAAMCSTSEAPISDANVRGADERVWSSETRG